MAYIYKEKLNLLELAGVEREIRKVALAIADQYLRDIYRHHLRQHDFVVTCCHPREMLHEHVNEERPHLLVINLEDLGRDYELLGTLLLIRKAHPYISLVTLGSGVPGELLGKIMNAGVASHIDRRLGRPKDVVEVVKLILKETNTNI